MPAKTKKKVKKYPLVNRELSWLAFNARVLQEAGDPGVPLIERIRFLAIFSSNLDEFFRVRVATIGRIYKLKKAMNASDTADFKKILHKIRAEVMVQQQSFDEIYEGQIIPALAAAKIEIVDDTQLRPQELETVRDYFLHTVAQDTHVLMLEKGRDIPVLRDGSIYLAIRLSRKTRSGTKYALVRVPSAFINRFYCLPGAGAGHRIILLDDVIRASLDILFSSLDYDEYSAHTVKLTRDAELDFDDEIAAPLMDKVRKSLKQRETGVPTRFLYDKDIPKDLLHFLISRLKIEKQQAIPGGRYHNFRDFMDFPDLDRPELLYPERFPQRIKALDKDKSILHYLQKQDLMLNFPYQSFDYIIRLLREAAINPQVYSIKMTMYRVAKDSAVANALINAVRNGKRVLVYTELRARFMEEHNIAWAQKLREEGVHVLDIIPGFKVHCKLILISMRDKLDEKHVVHIGTGNFNEDTAKLYADHSLLTGDKKMAAEVNKVFAIIENFKDSTAQMQVFKKIWVSPFNTKERFLELLKREVVHARKGRPARVIIKVNSLAEEEICQRILEAAKAGVQVDLIVRGIFRPKLPKEMDSLRAISIIDRYLEHARLFWFQNNGKSEMYLGSADFMDRNLNHRIEVTSIVEDKEIAAQLLKILEMQLGDNVKARILEGKMHNYFAHSSKKPLRSQEEIYKLLRGDNR